MASYQAPQVDHNLYTPVLPQTNIAELFQLISMKQEMYNTNLARINQQASAMNELETNITNPLVKEKVNKFNQQANDFIRKNASLDFSIQDNVRLFDNLYDPLTKDQDFLTDYHATSHYRNQIQKGLLLKDSVKKEDRESFSLTNFQYVTNSISELETAKNSKELEQAAGNVKNRYYVPYTNYMGNVLTKIKDLAAKVTRDEVNGGYKVTYTNGSDNKTYVFGLKQFLMTTLSTQDKQQMMIESTVAVDNLIQQLGKDKVVETYFMDNNTTSDKIIEQYTKKINELTTKQNFLGQPGKLSNEQKQLKELIADHIDDYNERITNLQKRKVSLNESLEKIKNGTYTTNDIIPEIINDLTTSQLDIMMNDLVTSYADATYETKISEDTTYTSMQSLAETRRHNIATEKETKRSNLAQEDLDKETLLFNYRKEGLIPSESLIPNELKGKENVTFEDPLSSLQEALLQKNLSSSDQENYEREMLDRYIKTHGKNPTDAEKQILYSLDSNDKKLLTPEFLKIREKYLRIRSLARSNANEARIELQTAINEYNKVNKTQLKLDKNNKIISNKSTQTSFFEYPISSTWVALRTALSMGIDALALPNPMPTKSYMEQYEEANTIEDPAIQDFKKWFNSSNNKKNSFATGIVEVERLSANKTGRATYNTKYYNSVADYFRSNPDFKTSDVKRYNKITGIDSEVLNEAYNILKYVNANPEVFVETTKSVRQRGLNIKAPDLTWEKVYPNTKQTDVKNDDVRLKAFNLIRSQGLNLPLGDITYSTQDIRKNKLYTQGSAEYGGYTTSTLPNGESTIVPSSSDQKHYYSGNSQGGYFKVMLDKNSGRYNLVPSSLPISIGNIANTSDIDEINRISIISKTMETDDFTNALNKILKKNPTYLVNEENGMYAVPNSLIENLVADFNKN